MHDDTDTINETTEFDHHHDDLNSSPAPAWPKWIGGLTIAYAALMLTCAGLGTAMLPLQERMVEPLLEGAPMPEGMKATGMDWALMGTGLVLTLFLLFGGIFCVTRNPLARILVLIWAVPSIPMSLYNYVRQMEKQDSIRAWAEQYPSSPLAQQMNAGGQAGQQIGEIIGLVFTILLGVLVPAFYIIWFGFIKSKPEQMTGSSDTFA